MYNTCTKCGYRGDYDEYCPECHSTEFEGQYGEDTTIFITTENLSSEITLDSDIDSAKNCFRVEGGDDNITAAVSNVNPNGTSYIYQIADWMKKDMPDELVVRLNEYENKYNEYLEKTYLINSQEMTLRYNDIVQYVEERYPSQTFEKIPLDDYSFGKIETYEKLTDYYYQSISLYSYLNDAMMPEMETVNKDIDSQLEILSAITSIAVNINVSSVQQGAVENAINSYARCLIDTSLFSIELLESNYATATHIWTGKIQLTEIADDTNVKSTDTLTITVNGNVLNFVQEKVQKTISKKKINDITNISDVKNVPLKDFKKYLHYYSYSELKKIYQCFDDCTSVIVESVAETEDENIKKSVDDYRLEYQNRLVEINAVMKLRKSQLDVVTNIQNYIVKNKLAVRSELDIQTFLGDVLYKIFFAYRREQKYSNDNYVSDDLTDSELIQKARELFEKAQKELDKASKITYSISATLNNLLAIPKFAPLRDYFEIGNWIRVEIDDEIYKLRLTSYDINYDDLDSISVEFSNVTKNSCTTASVQDVLNAASSISTTYNALTQQMDYTKSTNSIIKNWVYEGLDTTMTKIVNNAETQDVTIGTSGIYCRAYDDIKGDYDDCYLRIINNGMYLFTDGGKTLKTAVGKFWYNNKIVYGINAEVLVGNLLAGNQLVIGDAEGSVRITKDGITLDGGAINWKTQLKTSAVEGLDDSLNKYEEDLSNFQTEVDKELAIAGVTRIGNDYLFSPKIASGYLYISKDGCSVQIDPARTYQSDNPKVINVQAKSSDVFYIKRDGSGYFKGNINATSLTLSKDVTISNSNIEGLSTVATSGKYSDLNGIPDLTIYETKSDVDEKLKGYATSGDLKAYLKTDDLNSKLGELDVAYSGDVKTTQTKDETTGLITTTNTYKDSDGKTHSYTTYTYEDSNYVLLNRESKWGNGSLGGENNLVKISKDGLLEANNAIIHGEIYASKGTFSGSLSSATGTFSGALQCGLQDDGSYKAYISSHGEAHFSSLTTNGASIENANIKFKYSNDSGVLNGGLSFYDNAWEEGSLIAKTYCRRTQGVILNLSAKNGLELSSEGYITIGNCTKMGIEPSPSIFISGNGVSLSNVSDINSHSLKNLRYIDNISTLTFSSSTSVKSDNTIDLSNTYTLKSSTNKIMIIPVSTGRFNIMSTSKTQSGTTLTISMKCRNVAPSEGPPSVSCYIVEYQSKSTSTTR